MSQYFLIKEQNYTDGVQEKKDISIIQGINPQTYKEALNKAIEVVCKPDDIIYIVDVVGKRFGNLNSKETTNG